MRGLGGGDAFCGLFAGRGFRRESWGIWLVAGSGIGIVRGVDVASEECIAGALAEVMFAAELAEDAGHAVAVGCVDEVCRCEAADVELGEVWYVLTNEAQPGWTRARFEKQRVGTEEAGTGGGGAGGDGFELRDAVVDAGE